MRVIDATGELLPNVTPGEMLRLEFLEPLRLSARALARDIGVPPNRITEILNGERAISAETAILMSRRFGTSAEFWLNLQMAYDLEEARRRLEAASWSPGATPLKVETAAQVCIIHT